MILQPSKRVYSGNKETDSLAAGKKDILYSLKTTWPALRKDPK
jgi:hypothetical protein